MMLSMLTLVTLITIPLSALVTAGIARQSQKYFSGQQRTGAGKTTLVNLLMRFQARISMAREAGVPITNYGMTIAWAMGILEGAVEPFDSCSC